MRDDCVDEPTADAIGPAVPLEPVTPPTTKRGRTSPPPNDPANPRPHPDQYEMARRMEAIIDLIVEGNSKVEIRHHVATETDWALADRTFEEYWKRANGVLRKDADRKRQPEVAKAIRRNDMVFKRAMKGVGDNGPDLSAALRANLQNARLLGLEAPKVLQHGNDPDNPLPAPSVTANVSAAVSITFVESDE